LKEMEDRLTHGDWIFNRAIGTLERKPVSLRDTTQAFNSIHDRKQKLDTKPRDDQQNKQVMDRLANLASKFEEIANKKQPIQVTDVIYAEEVRQVQGGETTERIQQEESDRQETGNTATV